MLGNRHFVLKHKIYTPFFDAYCVRRIYTCDLTVISLEDILQNSNNQEDVQLVEIGEKDGYK